jgi:hypothetical protein
MKIIKLRRNGKAEVGAGERVFSVAAVNCVAGKGREIAEIFHIATAIGACAVGAANPGNADARARPETSCRASLDWAGVDVRSYTVTAGVNVARDDFADDLMTGNNSRITWREFTLDNMKISAADPTCEHPQQNVTWFRLWRGDVFEVEWGFRNWGGSSKNCGFHEP